MSTVEEINSEISTRSEEKCAHLLNWFSGQDWFRWDEEIEKDSASGRFDFLIKEAAAEKNEGCLRSFYMHKTTRRFRRQSESLPGKTEELTRKNYASLKITLP